uniref:Uncharacterized protein n=1 Tax=Tetranychus urticae TaxID=32264 RepID=T1K9G0_TETUR
MIYLIYKCFKLTILLTLFSILLTWIKLINWLVGSCSHTLIGAFEIKDDDNFVSWDFTSTQTVDYTCSTARSSASSLSSAYSSTLNHHHSYKQNIISPTEGLKKRISPGVKLVLDY